MWNRCSHDRSALPRRLDVRRDRTPLLQEHCAEIDPDTIGAGVNGATALVEIFASIDAAPALGTLRRMLDDITLLVAELHAADLRQRIAARDVKPTPPSVSVDAGQTLH